MKQPLRSGHPDGTDVGEPFLRCYYFRGDRAHEDVINSRTDGSSGPRLAVCAVLVEIEPEKITRVAMGVLQGQCGYLWEMFILEEGLVMDKRHWVLQVPR